MFKSLSRPFRVSKSLRFVLVQTENTANSHCGLFKKLETDENLLELLLPRVTACRHSHTCHHTQRVAKEPISYASVAYQQDLCGKPFYPLVISQRYYALDSSTDDKKSKESSKNLSEKDEKSDELEGDKEDKPKGIMARFKEAYKEYGKALIGVHVVTSACWFGSFYFAAANGLDVVPLLEAIGASEKVIKAFQLPGVGNAAVAYLCYKVATPLRYTVTILGTQLTVKYMRRWGYWQPIKPEDSIRALVREGSENVKEKVKDRIDDVKDDMKDKITEMRGDMKDKYEDWKDKKKEDLKDWSEKKGEDIKEKVTDWTQSVKDRSHDVVQKSKKVMRNIEDRGKMDRFK